jgi:hypothetical protein
MLFSYDLVKAVERALIFKWNLNKIIYDNKEFLIEKIYKNSFILYYIQEYTLKHDQRKKILQKYVTILLTRWCSILLNHPN